MSERVPSLWVPGDENLHAQCKVYDVYKRHYRHPGDGRSGDFYIIHCNDWVQTLPLTEDGQVILVRQYRSFFVLAEGCTLHSAQNLDQHEELEVKLFPLAEVSRMARNGGISHALAINAVFFLESYLAGQPVMADRD